MLGSMHKLEDASRGTIAASLDRLSDRDRGSSFFLLWRVRVGAPHLRSAGPDGRMAFRATGVVSCSRA
jgi:hypothetical protein